MSTTLNDARKRIRRKTILYSLATTALVATLLYLEQVAILFILATLALSIFLAVVGLADLKGNELRLQEQAESEHLAESKNEQTQTPQRLRRRGNDKPTLSEREKQT